MSRIAAAAAECVLFVVCSIFSYTAQVCGGGCALWATTHAHERANPLRNAGHVAKSVARLCGFWGRMRKEGAFRRVCRARARKAFPCCVLCIVISCAQHPAHPSTPYSHRACVPARARSALCVLPLFEKCVCLRVCDLCCCCVVICAVRGE